MDKIIKRIQYWRYLIGRLLVLDSQFQDFREVVEAKFRDIDLHMRHLERMIEHERSIRS